MKDESIKWFIHAAKNAGHLVDDGFGWIRLAIACGHIVDSKGEARAVLRKRFALTTPERAKEHSLFEVQRTIAEYKAHKVKGVMRKLHKKTRDHKRDSSHISRDAFLLTYEWRKLRMQAIKRYGAKCSCCGATPTTGARMNVDHIKPRRIYPELALDINNLQVLCHECNHGKGNWDMTDWRKSEREAPL